MFSLLIFWLSAAFVFAFVFDSDVFSYNVKRYKMIKI
jgi:hypothetical protein